MYLKMEADGLCKSGTVLSCNVRCYLHRGIDGSWMGESGYRSVENSSLTSQSFVISLLGNHEPVDSVNRATVVNL